MKWTHIPLDFSPKFYFCSAWDELASVCMYFHLCICQKTSEIKNSVMNKSSIQELNLFLLHICAYTDANRLSGWRHVYLYVYSVYVSVFFSLNFFSLSRCFSLMIYSDVVNQSHTQHRASESNCSQGMVNSFTLKGIVFPVIVLGDLQTRLSKVPLRLILFHQIYRLPVSWLSLFLAPSTSATKEQLCRTRSMTFARSSWKCGFHLLHGLLFVTHPYQCFGTKCVVCCASLFKQVTFILNV